MAKHRAPRYVRTKKAIAKAPVAAGATVVGLGVLSSSPAQAADGGAPAAAAAPLTPTPAAETAAAAPADSYTVQRGDTMAEIAATLDQSWRDLYQRNVGLIGGDPNLILPGQVLLVAGDAQATAAPVEVGSVGNSAPVAAAAPAPAAPAAPAAAPAPAPATAQITNSAGAVRPQAQAAADAVVTNVPGAAGITIGGTRSSAVDPHGHPSGLALDYMVLSDAALGDAIAQYQIDHWDELGVEYVIWQQRILTSPTGSWKPMEDRGSATANHFDHVHVNYVG
ncbi:LysM peptidoglycan-binding domain-containing protein [Geodermatophilus sp. SYSU D00965]